MHDLWGPSAYSDILYKIQRRCQPPELHFINDINRKSDENLMGVSLRTPPSLPPPNKWIKRKAALLSPLPLSVWEDSGIWWILIIAIQCWFTCHVITQVPSRGLPQDESVPRALHVKFLHCHRVRKCVGETDCHAEGLRSLRLKSENLKSHFLLGLVQFSFLYTNQNCRNQDDFTPHSFLFYL